MSKIRSVLFTAFMTTIERANKRITATKRLVLMLPALWLLAAQAAVPQAEAPAAPAQAAGQDFRTDKDGLYEWAGPVMDVSGLLSPEDRNDLADFLNRLHEDKGFQLAVMVVPSMNGDATFCTKHLAKWQKEQPAFESGALLTIATSDNRVGMGKGKKALERLTPELTDQVFDDYLIPDYSAGRKAESIRKAVLRTAVILSGDESLTFRRSRQALKVKPALTEYRKNKEGLYDWTGSFVLDAADILSAAQYGELAGYLLDLNDSTGIQIAVLTVPTTDGEPVHDFAVRHFDKWKLGQKGIDNGALLTIVMDSHDLDITTGDGTEGVLTDLLCKRIIDDVLVPAFRGGTQGAGVISAVHNMAGIITQDDSLVTVSREGGTGEDAKWYEILGGAVIFLLLMFFVGKAVIGGLKDILDVVLGAFGIDIGKTTGGRGSSYSDSASSYSSKPKSSHSFPHYKYLSDYDDDDSYSSSSYSSSSSSYSSRSSSSSSSGSSSYRSGGGGRTSGGGASGKW